MEMINGKADALKNKMRPGSIFVSKRTDNLKYVDQNGAECWVVPMSRYYASETILRGQPVAICQISDFESDDERASDKYPYIKVYNPNVDEFCIGVATNYAEEGTIVQIQNKGKFNYLTTASKKAQKEGESPKEVYINTKMYNPETGEKDTWLYNKMRGQTIYVCANEVEYPNNHDSKKDSVDTSKTLTYDFIDSVYTTKNTIQLGNLTDAPTTEADDDQVVTIELNVTGDTRGPLDNTQYVLTLGEDIFFKEGDPKPAKGLIEPYNDQGIFNEVKAVALATHGPEKSKFGWYPKSLHDGTIGTNTSFIAVRKMDGKSVIVSKFDDFEKLCNALTAANDRGYMSLLKSTFNETYDANKPVMIQVEEFTMEVAKKKIIDAFQTLDPKVFAEIKWTATDASSTAEIKPLEFEAAEVGGYYDIYESEDLVRFVNLKTMRHGSEAPAGTAILADIRDENRTNVVGVVLSNQPGIHKKGETIKVMKLGRFVANGIFKPGAEYFLGLEGRINTKKHYWYDTAVKIGVAENDKQLLVDVQEMQHEFNGSFPLGYIKQSMGGEAERGFLLMDGVTGYDVGTYPELLEALRAWYKDEELAYYEDVSKGDGSVERTRNNNKFIIPKVTFNDGMNVAEIKAIPDGIYHMMPRLPFIRGVGNINADGTIDNIDVTRLVHYGTLEQSRIAPTLENIEVRLFVREPQTTLYEDLQGQQQETEEGDRIYADEYVWREIPKGFQLYNNDQIFGYEWVILQSDYAASNWVGIDEKGKPVERRDGLYVLHMNIEKGLGICKFGQNAQPISLKGAEYKVIVTAKNLWEREYNLMEVEDLADSLEMDNDTMAPTVSAVKRYYEKEVRTRRLEVTDANGKTQATIDDAGTRIEKLSVGSIEVDGKDIVYEAEQFADHLAQTTQGEYDGIDENGNPIKIKGVHGLYNAGVDGNINAKYLGGLKVSDGARSLAANTSEGYIPYVQITGDTDIGLNLNRYTQAVANGKLAELVISNAIVLQKDANKLLDTTTVADKDVKQYIKQLNFGTTVLKTIFDQGTDKVDVYVSEGLKKNINVHGLNNIDVNQINFGGSYVLTAANVQQLTGGSTIALKNVFFELLRYIPESYNLKPNTTRDAEGKLASDWNPGKTHHSYKEMKLLKLKDADAEEKEYEVLKTFGSALQAVHEMPLALWEYKYGNSDYKEQLGILIERVNQARKQLTKNSKAFAHKRNSWMQSADKSLLDANDGYDESNLYGHTHAANEIDVYDKTANEAHGSLTTQNRIANNVYNYTKAEAESIVNYLNLTTSKKELQQEIRSTVGILLKAAQETQDRLLDVETSIFGFDAATVPGEKITAVENCITDETLRAKINSTPLFLGLNRLMRAICLELFDTTDLEKIDAETKSVLGDSDNLQTRVTMASRMDKIDELIGDLIARYNGLVRFYEDALNHAELKRTYEHLSNGDGGTNVISTEAALTEQETILEDEGLDDHDRTKQVDSSGTWATLPSEEDLVDSDENFVGYSEVNTDHLNKHRPRPGKDDEVGIVRIPEFEDAEFPFQVSVIEDGEQVVKPITIRQIKYDYDTGLPYFKSQGVAWLDSKVERINLKLSEVTKTIYGIDEVGQALPNRTETMRRNITNLVDDLYPNRSFAVENKVKGDYDIYNPYENSTDIVNGSKNINKDGNDIQPTNRMTDESEIGGTQHTSIIKHLVDDMYSYNISQLYLPAASVAFNQPVEGKNKWPQDINDSVINSEANHYITLDASNLTSEVAETAGRRSFTEAYSQFDLLRDVIGLKNVWVNELSSAGNFWNYFNDSKNWPQSAVQGNILAIEDSVIKETQTGVLAPNWTDELKFKKATYATGEDNQAGTLVPEESSSSREILSTGYVDTILSRKEKDIASRLTTVEAALDSTAHFVKAVVDNSARGLGTSKLNHFGLKNQADKARFEDMNIEDSLSKAVHGVNSGDNDMWTLFNTDFEECNTISDAVRAHNLAIMNLIKNDYKILGWEGVYDKDSRTRVFNVKRSYAIVNDFAHKDDTDLFGIKDKDDTTEITVAYVTAAPTSLDTKTIYLKKEEVTDESAIKLIEGVSEDIAGIHTKEDQSTQNELELMRGLMAHVYQDSFDMAHPEGSYYWASDYIEEGIGTDKVKKPNFHIPEYAARLINVGTWERVTDKFILAQGDEDRLPEGNMDGTINLTASQLPKHSHSAKGISASYTFVNVEDSDEIENLGITINENTLAHDHSIEVLNVGTSNGLLHKAILKSDCIDDTATGSATNFEVVTLSSNCLIRTPSHQTSGVSGIVLKEGHSKSVELQNNSIKVGTLSQDITGFTATKSQGSSEEKFDVKVSADVYLTFSAGEDNSSFVAKLGYGTITATPSSIAGAVSYKFGGNIISSVKDEAIETYKTSNINKFFCEFGSQNLSLATPESEISITKSTTGFTDFTIKQKNTESTTDTESVKVLAEGSVSYDYDDGYVNFDTTNVLKAGVTDTNNKIVGFSTTSEQPEDPALKLKDAEVGYTLTTTVGDGDTLLPIEDYVYAKSNNSWTVVVGGNKDQQPINIMPPYEKAYCWKRLVTPKPTTPASGTSSSETSESTDSETTGNESTGK